ncbi:MAG: CHAP domain-containing protein [Micropepsaceae bacterium]
MQLNTPDVEPVVTPEGNTRLVMMPRMSRGIEETSFATIDSSVPGHVVPQVIDPGKRLECVPFARAESGIEIRGNANRWWQLAAGKYQRTRRPTEGAVFVMKGYQTTRRGHVAVVKQVIDARTIVVDHANWGNDGRIYLQAPVRDLSPKNDWSRVQVWFTPANQWGRRIYKGRGFILPSSNVASISDKQAMTLIGGAN